MRDVGSFDQGHSGRDKERWVVLRNNKQMLSIVPGNVLELMHENEGDVKIVSWVVCLPYYLDSGFCLLKCGLLMRSGVENEECKFRSELTESDI